MDGRMRQPPSGGKVNDASSAPATQQRRVDPGAVARAVRGGPVDTGAVLALQRAAGNRAVARKAVPVYLGTPPVKRARPKPPPAIGQATAQNVGLAKEIDALELLKDDELLDRRTAVALKVAGPAGADQQAALRTLEAIEFVANRRGLAPAKGNYGRGSWGRDDIRRVNVRAETEKGIRETGSFKRGINSFTHTTEVEGDIAALEAEAESFKTAFRGQARTTAEHMLTDSLTAMDKVLSSYGIPTDSARFAGARVAEGGGVDAEAEQIVKRAKDSPTINDKGLEQHRRRLSEWAERLKKKQKRVKDLDDRIGKLATHAPPNLKGPRWEEIKKLSARLLEHRAALASTWIEAERLHPVLAAYRSGDPLEKIDLKALDSFSVDDEMKEVLVSVLPKIGNSEKALSMIRSGALSPLTLPSVVGLTSVTMFIPPGSIRAGVVQDLVEAERKKREHLWVDIAALALAVVTLIPSAGASLAIPAGMVSVSLAAVSAAETYDRNQRQKTLVNTDLDRARSLSDEEPSMTSFAWSLVSLGLEGFALVHAFKAARNIRHLVEEGKDVTKAVNELNQFGSSKRVGNLGTQAVQDAEKGLGREAKITTAAESPKTPATATHDPPRKSPEPVRDVDPAAKKKPLAEPKKKPADEPRKKPLDDPAGKVTDAPTVSSTPKPASVKAAKLGFAGGKADVRSKLDSALRNLKTGMDEANLPSDYLAMIKKLKAAGPEYDELARLTPEVMGAIRNPQLWDDLFVQAWERGVANDTGVNAALLSIASDEGLTVKVITGKAGDLNGPVFFNRHASKPVSWIDKPFASPDPHSSMIHVVQDIVANRALKAKGSSAAHYRSLLGKAKAEVRVPGKLPRGEPRMVKWGDYVWRTTYDGTSNGHMNTPEWVAPILQKLFKLR